MFQRVFSISDHLNNLPFARHRTYDRIFNKIYNGSDISQPNPFPINTEISRLLFLEDEDGLRLEELDNTTVHLCKVVYLSHFLNKKKNEIESMFTFKDGNIITKGENDESVEDLMSLVERAPKERNLELYERDLLRCERTEDGKKFICHACNKCTVWEQRWRHFQSDYHRRRMEK
jgi:hypothetical protein